jgi:hypothetical protein
MFARDLPNLHKIRLFLATADTMENSVIPEEDPTIEFTATGDSFIHPQLVRGFQQL